MTFSLLGCRASVSANAKVGGEDEVEDFDKPLDTTNASFAEQTADEDLGYALLGARHDLTLSDAGKQLPAACSCLTIKVATVTDTAFQWQAAIPKVDPNNQLVVALSSESHSCEGEPKDSLGASYRGYEREGDDVIIIIENARFGRPLTTGAIIPKPVGDGRIYVRPASKGVPYGRNNNATELCRLR